MSDFKTKMHQLQFRLGVHPRPRWGVYSTPRPPSWIQGGLLQREGRRETREEGTGKGGGKAEGKGYPPMKILATPLNPKLTQLSQSKLILSIEKRERENFMHHSIETKKSYSTEVHKRGRLPERA